MIDEKSKPNLKNQVSVLAFFALLIVSILGGFNIRDNIRTGNILSEQKRLLEIKDTLSSIEQEALSARLDEVNMISRRDVEYFERFLIRMARVKQLSNELLTISEISTHLSPEFTSTLEVALIHTLGRYEDSVRETQLIERNIGYRQDQGLMLEIEIIRDNIVTILDDLNHGNLQLEFAQIQLLERDFLNTLNMGIANDLTEEIKRFQATVVDTSISNQVKSQLNNLIQTYEALLNQSVEGVVELELAKAENKLQFNRIRPEITKSQAELNLTLNLLQQRLVQHRQISALQTGIFFCGSLLIILAFIIIQIRNSHELVQRLKQLARQMNKVASGRFPDEAKLPYGQDEVGVLSTTFLAMASQIQAQIETIEEERKRAEVASQAKSVFLANMSHELRTPLNAILGFTQIMQYEVSPEVKHGEYLNIINTSGEHLLGLINDVLEMSKLESGKFTLKPTNFELDHILETVYGLLRNKAHEKGITLTLTRSPEVPNYIFGDEAKLRQILINLLGNGIKFTDSGRVSLTITGKPITVKQQPTSHLEMTGDSSAQGQPWCLAFEVEDTGPGIAPEDFDLLFEAFSQTELGQSIQEGTGLGLSISHRFVQLMGGELTVHSQLGVGSVFKFEIRVEQRTLSTSTIAKTSSIPDRKIVGLAPGQTPFRILIVEDHDKNRLLLQDLLRSMGFKVREAGNGQTAITLWQNWQPALILMDIQMPIMNGYTTVRQIRTLERSQLESSTEIVPTDQTLKPQIIAPDSRHPEYPSENSHPHKIHHTLVTQNSSSPSLDMPSTKIIAITANAFDGQRQAILQAGCDDFVSKPINSNALLELIGRHLGVTYAYSDVEVTASSALPHLLSQRLTTMPPKWITRLYQAALQGDDGTVIQLIAKIPTENSANEVVISTLTQWAENYQFERILTLTEVILPTTSESKGSMTEIS